MENNILFCNKTKKLFYVHHYGFIVNLQTGYVITSKNKANYINVIDRKFKMDRIIYCFHNNIDYNNKLIIHHIDNNVLNNNINNLKLIENKEQYLKIKKYPEIYNSINYIILYKKYDNNFNLMNVYTHYRHIPYADKIHGQIEFLKELLIHNIVYKRDCIWEIEIKTINVNKQSNYKFIDNSLFRISNDNTHIIDMNNKIYNYIYYNHQQYINITDLDLNIVKIYYQYKKDENDFYLNFNNFIEKNKVDDNLYNIFYKELIY